MDYIPIKVLALFLTLQILEQTTCHGSTIYMDEATSIFKTIFPTYNKNVPPRKNYPQPIMLDLMADVIHVSDLDAIRQVLTSTVDLTVMWMDTRLAWNSQSVKEINVNKTLVWKPEISIVNAVGQTVSVEAPDLVLSGSGEIKWVRRLQINTACPHDTNNKTVGCDIIFGAGIHLEYKLSDFGNVTDKTCSSALTSTKMFDLSMEGSKLEDDVIGNVTIEADPEITCTVILTKKPGCCNQRASTQSGNSDNGENMSVSLVMSELLLSFSFLLYFVLAQ